tara:strand:- start:1247 stop:2089 length:843 start_codon:yes stop_codon:yes gene_type:complete
MNLKIDKNKIKNGLYVVSTPIGNLRDITLRSLDILKASDFILCEDTRVSTKLLNTYNVNKLLISNHKFNEKKNLVKIVQKLKSGKIISLISDAGTPAISDPGRILINECIKNNIDVFPIPGPSAVSAAVSISGFSDQYYFHGFLPDKLSSLTKDLEYLSNLNSSIVFFISAKKFNKIIDILKKNFNNRKLVLCKEITKYFEEYHRIDIKNLKPFVNLKGEITVIISDQTFSKKKEMDESDKIQIKNMIKNNSIKDIVNVISQNKNIPKKTIYNYCLKIKK